MINSISCLHIAEFKTATRNCWVHSELLLEHLRHRRTLKRPNAIRAIEEKILFEARQVERILNSI
jgi:stalled ribosome alternative rescue factor ArfA